ncbi:hypothetical protein J6590_010413 [Homalodisca vitripennis]|nr:hypothetical protein J6590_010413 [Homalodisca vitripennis]
MQISSGRSVLLDSLVSAACYQTLYTCPRYTEENDHRRPRPQLLAGSVSQCRPSLTRPTRLLTRDLGAQTRYTYLQCLRALIDVYAVNMCHSDNTDDLIMNSFHLSRNTDKEWTSIKVEIKASNLPLRIIIELQCSGTNKQINYVSTAVPLLPTCDVSHAIPSAVNMGMPHNARCDGRGQGSCLYTGSRLSARPSINDAYLLCTSFAYD